MSLRKSLQHAAPMEKKAPWPAKRPDDRPQMIKATKTEPVRSIKKGKPNMARGLSDKDQIQTFLAHLLDNLKVGVMVLTPEGRVALLNQAAADLLSQDSTFQNPFEEELRMKSLDKWAEPLWDAGRSGLCEDGREIIILRGPEDRLLSCSVSPFPWPGDEQSEHGVIVQIEDITGQVSLGAQRDRSRTLSAMGEMASEVAHQVRNPLGGIELFASILGREVSEDQNLSRLVEHVLGGVRQVNHLLTNYLALANPPRPQKVPACLDPLIEEALAAADRALEQKKIKAALKPEKNPVWIEADPELLLQVFLNMILNAVEALEFGGSLELEIKTNGRRAER